jgi:hypothetical protein
MVPLLAGQEGAARHGVQVLAEVGVRGRQRAIIVHVLSVLCLLLVLCCLRVLFIVVLAVVVLAIAQSSPHCAQVFEHGLRVIGPELVALQALTEHLAGAALHHLVLHVLVELASIVVIVIVISLVIVSAIVIIVVRVAAGAGAGDEEAAAAQQLVHLGAHANDLGRVVLQLQLRVVRVLFPLWLVVARLLWRPAARVCAARLVAATARARRILGRGRLLSCCLVLIYERRQVAELV